MRLHGLSTTLSRHEEERLGQEQALSGTFGGFSGLGRSCDVSSGFKGSFK